MKDIFLVPVSWFRIRNDSMTNFRRRRAKRISSEFLNKIWKSKHALRFYREKGFFLLLNSIKTNFPLARFGWTNVHWFFVYCIFFLLQYYSAKKERNKGKSWINRIINCNCVVFSETYRLSDLKCVTCFEYESKSEFVKINSHLSTYF